MNSKDLQGMTKLLERAVEGVWDVAADNDEALETVDLGQGRVQLRPHPRLIERIAAECDRLGGQVGEWVQLRKDDREWFGETDAIFATEVRDELARARSKFGPIASLHEGYAVILEELDEFWDEVRGQQSDDRLRQAYRELVQVAAMAQRTAEDAIARLESKP